MKNESKYYWQTTALNFHIKPTYALEVPVVETNYISDKRHNLSDESNRRTGFISSGSAKRIKDVVNLMVECAEWKQVFEKSSGKWWKFKLSFITLTLPVVQQHNDNFILTKIFQPFIRCLRLNYGLKCYLWKSEVQDNGNLHFHLTTDIFIHWRKLRSEWNYYCSRADYIDPVTNPDPNSTDIHACKNARSLGAYLNSYISKKDSTLKKPEAAFNCSRNHFYHAEILEAASNKLKRVVKCKLWDASMSLKQAKKMTITYNMITHAVTDYAITGLDEVMHGWKDAEHCRIYFLNERKFRRHALGRSWNKYIDDLKVKLLSDNKSVIEIE